MTSSFLDCVLRGAEALAARDPVGTLPDAGLLKRYAANGDAAAFAVIVRRHGPLVWGVCRNMLAADADAEDAFQATFLALVRSVGTIRRTEALGGWLHGVAYRVAMKARRSAARRKKRELIAASPEPDSPVSDAAWDELQAAVHEEVCRLPEKLRLPFVLCGLQGRAQKDAARQLGWTIGTLSGRLTLARQRLLDRLARRGVPVGVAAGAAVLGATSGNAAVPTAIVMRAMAAAKSPDSVSPLVINLARGVTHMYLTRTKMLVAGVIVAGLLTTGIGSQLMSLAEAQAPPRQENDADLVKRALEYLAAQQKTQDRWEYKFVPVKSTIDAAELQKMLTAHDREGWEYCGSQNLAVAGAAVPHLTFKRPNTVAARQADPATLQAIAAFLAAESKSDAATKAALLREYYARTGQKGAAEFYDAVRQRELDAARKRELDLDMAKKAELEARRLAEDELKHLSDAERKSRAQDSQLKNLADQERAKAEQLQRDIQKLRAEYELLLNRVDELHDLRSRVPDKGPAENNAKLLVPKPLKTQDVIAVMAKILPDVKVLESDQRDNSITVRGSAATLAKVKDIIAKIADSDAVKQTPKPAGDNQAVVVALKHADAINLLKMLDNVSSDIKVTADERTNSIVLKVANDTSAAKVKDIIQRIDAFDAAMAKARVGGDKVSIVVVPLKRIDGKAALAGAAETIDKINKVSKTPIAAEPTPNSVILAGPADLVEKVKKEIESLDTSRTPRK